ncbi:MAG TPA: nuclear transport factor 2 family protein [Candidatus Limnocylindrales bacterium]|nr:nuclear transport factor 2 family protein [Candidatus Limnocylindrales bacterium]
MDEIDRLAQGLADVLSKGDGATLAAVFTEDYVEEYPQSGERIEGRETVRRMLDAFPDGTRPRVRGDWQVTRYDGGFVGEYTLDYGPGGLYRVVGFYTVRADRISASREYFAAPFEPADWRRPFVTARGDDR